MLNLCLYSSEWAPIRSCSLRGFAYARWLSIRRQSEPLTIPPSRGPMHPASIKVQVIPCPLHICTNILSLSNHRASMSGKPGAFSSSSTPPTLRSP